MSDADGETRAPERESLVWGLVLAVLWVAIVTVIAVAADDEPAIEAATVVFMLPLAAFGLSVAAGLRGREVRWTMRFAAATALPVALAYFVALVVRWEPGEFYIVPIIALVLGLVLWLVSGAGWLLGAVVRGGLGMGGDDEHDDSLDPNRL
jgi:peptidoglycan/LPS O-acetylase OafA/YrhL